MVGRGLNPVKNLLVAVTFRQLGTYHRPIEPNSLLMKRNLAIPLAILLIVGAVAIVVLKKDDTPDPTTAGTEQNEGKKDKVRPSNGTGTSSTRSTRPSAPPSARRSRESELVEKYGREKTTKAREVSENVVAILEDAVAVGELMMKGGQQMGFRRRGMVNGLVRRMGIELTEEQQDEALSLMDDWQNAELEKSKKIIATLQDDPTAMMELFLAGDATHNGDMSEDEFSTVRDEAAERLGDVINPLDQNNFRGDRRMANDEDLMNRFADILDPEQQEQFSNYREERAESGEQRSPTDGNISTIPTMELDNLGQAVGNARKMTSGFRTLMEGMGGLQQLQPRNGPGSGGGE